MLRVTTKNAAYEVVSCLVEFKSRGVLTSIIEWMNREQSKKTQAAFHKREDGSHSARGPPPHVPNFFSEKRNSE